MTELPTRFRYEVYDGYKGVGTFLGLLSDESLMEASIRQEENGAFSLTLRMPSTAPTARHIVPRKNLIYVVNMSEYHALGDAAAQPFRVAEVRRSRDDSGHETIDATCEHITSDMLSEVIPTETLYAGTKASELLARIMDGSPAFTAGTVAAQFDDPASLVQELRVGPGPRLEALRALASTVGGRLVVNTDRSVDLLARKVPGVDAPSVFVRLGKNLQSLEATRDMRRLVTRMYGVGGGDPRLGLSGCWHRVVKRTTGAGSPTYVVNLWVHKLAPSDGSFYSTGGQFGVVVRQQMRGPVAEERGAVLPVIGFVARDPAVTSRPDKITVTDNVGTTHSFYSNYSDTDLVQVKLVWRPVAGTGPWADVSWVEDKEFHAQYGYVDGISEHSDIERTDNIFEDPFLSNPLVTWTGSMPFPNLARGTRHPLINPSNEHIDASEVLPSADRVVFSKNTDRQYITNGIYSQKVLTRRRGTGVFVLFNFNLAENESRYFSTKVRVYLAVGQLRCEVAQSHVVYSSTPAETGVMFPRHDQEPVVIPKIGEVLVPGWYDITLQGIENIDPINQAAATKDLVALDWDDLNTLATWHNYGVGWFYLYQYGEDPCEFYVDSIDLQPYQSVAPEWADGDARRALWDKAYDDLWPVRGGHRSYVVGMRDLYLEGRNAYDAFGVGDVVDVKDTDLGVDAVQLYCSSKTTDTLNPGETEVQLDTVAEAPLDRAADALVALSDAQRQVANVVRRGARDRIMSAPVKRVLVAADGGGKPTVETFDLHSEDERWLVRTVWAGNVKFGDEFLNYVEVPPGRKLIWQFTASGSDIVSTIPDSWEKDEIEFGGVGRDRRIRNDDGGTYAMLPPAVIMQEDNAEHPVRWITEFVREHQPLGGGTGATDGKPARSVAWTDWIGPGKYTQLRFFRLGETLDIDGLTNKLNRNYKVHVHNDPVAGVTGAPNAPNTGQPVVGGFILYRGRLHVMEVPLRTAVALDAIVAGALTFAQAISDGLLGRRQSRGNVSLGLAKIEPRTANEEVIAIAGVTRNLATTLYHPFQLYHDAGATIEEYSDNPRFSITDGYVIPFYMFSHVPDVAAAES